MYLHRATVALLSLFQKSVPTDSWSHDPGEVWLVKQAAGVAAGQVPLIVGEAAATECAWNIIAARNKQRFFFF